MSFYFVHGIITYFPEGKLNEIVLKHARDHANKLQQFANIHYPETSKDDEKIESQRDVKE